MVGFDKRDRCFGDEAQCKPGVLPLEFSIVRDIVTNWDDMVTIWHHTGPALRTEASQHRKANCERMAQIMFETFHVLVMDASTSDVLSLRDSSRTTGTVMDSRGDVSFTVLILEGNDMTYAIYRLALAGRDLTHLHLKITAVCGFSLTNSAELDAQIPVQDFHNEIKVGFSPIGFVRCSRSACRFPRRKWKMGKETGGKKMEAPLALLSFVTALCSFHPQQPFVCDSFKNYESLPRVALIDGNGVVDDGLADWRKEHGGSTGAEDQRDGAVGYFLMGFMMGFVRCGRSACRFSKRKWKMGKETGGKMMEDPHVLKSNKTSQCSFQPQQSFVSDPFKYCESLSRVAFMDGNGVVMLERSAPVRIKVYSPIGFVQCDRSACRFSKRK